MHVVILYSIIEPNIRRFDRSTNQQTTQCYCIFWYSLIFFVQTFPKTNHGKSTIMTFPEVRLSPPNPQTVPANRWSAAHRLSLLSFHIALQHSMASSNTDQKWQETKAVERALTPDTVQSVRYHAEPMLIVSSTDWLSSLRVRWHEAWTRMADSIVSSWEHDVSNAKARLQNVSQTFLMPERTGYNPKTR